MVDSATFNLQPNFPIAGVSDLYANRPVKEAAMRAQQQKQLVEGLQAFGQGVDSLTNRRIQMAQALAGAKMYAQTQAGQQMLGTNQVTSTPASPMPVTQNQTANYNPATGSVTPNQSPVGINDIATSMFGMTPKDTFENLTKNKELSYEPQKLAIEAKKADAEAKTQQILATLKATLDASTIANQAKERQQAAENAALDANKETAKHFILHPSAAAKASKAISQAGQTSGPKIGDVEDGHKFLGGNPADPNSWKKV